MDKLSELAGRNAETQRNFSLDIFPENPYYKRVVKCVEEEEYTKTRLQRGFSPAERNPASGLWKVASEHDL